MGYNSLLISSGSNTSLERDTIKLHTLYATACAANNVWCCCQAVDATKFELGRCWINGLNLFFPGWFVNQIFVIAFNHLVIVDLWVFFLLYFSLFAGSFHNIEYLQLHVSCSTSSSCEHRASAYRLICWSLVEDTSHAGIDKDNMLRLLSICLHQWQVASDSPNWWRLSLPFASWTILVETFTLHFFFWLFFLKFSFSLFNHNDFLAWYLQNFLISSSLCWVVLLKHHNWLFMSMIYQLVVVTLLLICVRWEWITIVFPQILDFYFKKKKRQWLLNNHTNLKEKFNTWYRLCVYVNLRSIFTADHYVLVVDIAGSATEWIDVQRPTELCLKTNALFWCMSIAMSCSVLVHKLYVLHHRTMESCDSLKQSFASFIAYTYSNSSDVVFYVRSENKSTNCNIRLHSSGSSSNISRIKCKQIW